MLYMLFGFTAREIPELMGEKILPIMAKYGVKHEFSNAVALPMVTVMKGDNVLTTAGKAIGIPTFAPASSQNFSLILAEISALIPGIPIFALSAPVLAALDGQVL